MHPFAQTNIQLINQLRRDGYSSAEIGSVLSSYELSIHLFTGLFRASGKTFIAHVVGTASVLGSLRVPSKLVSAGLIHAAYTHGDFGNGEKGISDAKRNQVRSVVGNEVEDYVAKFTALRWNEDVISAIHDSLGLLDPVGRDVLLMRLANELEEYLDLGILYCGDEKRQQANYINRNGQLMTQMAEKLGFPALAATLEQAFKEAAVADLPPTLRRPHDQNDSFLVAPKLYQRMVEAVSSRLAGARRS